MATKHRLIYFENRKIFCSKEIKDKTLGDNLEIKLVLNLAIYIPLFEVIGHSTNKHAAQSTIHYSVVVTVR